jgi:murein DD-endopeptidase MepM/ murein hydrolase activator NlpD
MNKWQHPLPKSTITARFGATKNRKSPHRGTDYASPDKNALLSAVSAGVIAKIEYSACLGWYVVIKTDEDDVYFGYSHLYCNKHKTSECDGKDHANETCMKNLKVGQKVKAGQAVGRQGNSGTCSRGHHLHLTAHKTPDPRYAKVFDAEKFLIQKISASEKQEAQKKTPKPKTKVTESPVTAKQDIPDVIVPEDTTKPSGSIWDLMGALLAKKPTGEVCKCCGQTIK